VAVKVLAFAVVAAEKMGRRKVGLYPYCIHAFSITGAAGEDKADNRWEMRKKNVELGAGSYYSQGND
jgi:hypothetical protein